MLQSPLLLLVALVFGLVPMIVAYNRRHRSFAAIAILNLAAFVMPFVFYALTAQLYVGLVVLTGPALWLVAMVWACTGNVAAPVVHRSIKDPRWAALRSTPLPDTQAAMRARRRRQDLQALFGSLSVVGAILGLVFVMWYSAQPSGRSQHDIGYVTMVKPSGGCPSGYRDHPAARELCISP